MNQIDLVILHEFFYCRVTVVVLWLFKGKTAASCCLEWSAGALDVLKRTSQEFTPESQNSGNGSIRFCNFNLVIFGFIRYLLDFLAISSIPTFQVRFQWRLMIDTDGFQRLKWAVWIHWNSKLVIYIKQRLISGKNQEKMEKKTQLTLECYS